MEKYEIALNLTEREAWNYYGGALVARRYITVEAETAQGAVETARAQGFSVDASTVRSFSEIARLEAERVARLEAEARKKADAEARKLARDTAKAEAEGLTLEAWNERKKNLAKARRYQREIEQAREEIARLQAEIDYKEKRIAELEA